MKTIRYMAVLAGLLLLAGCTTADTLLGTGIAATFGALDQMMAGGVITPEQHQAIATGIQGLEQTNAALIKAQEGTLTSGEAYAAGGGLIGTALAAIRLWRGKPSKGWSKGVQNAVASAKE